MITHTFISARTAMAAVSIAGRGWRLHAATADPARGARNADDPDMADHVAQYAENGFTIYQDVLDPALMAQVARHVEWLKHKHPEQRPENLNETLAHGDPFWLRLVSDDRLLDIAEKYVGKDIALFQSHYICKEPHDGEPVLWHQDGKGWPVEPKDPMITLWLAVTESDDDNGCVRIIPKTQHDDWHEQVPGMRGDIVFGKTIPGYASPGEEPRAVSLCLKPGDVSVHSSRSVHGSEANRSARQRCGLTISYMPASSQLVAKSRPDFEGGWPCLYLLRGEATPGVNDHDGVSFAPWPTYVEGEHMPFADANPPFVLGTPRL